MPIAIEIFSISAKPAAVRIDINGAPWAAVETDELSDKLAEIGRAYSCGDLAQLLSEPRAPQQ
jgi:hypothetical protein